MKKLFTLIAIMLLSANVFCATTGKQWDALFSGFIDANGEALAGGLVYVYANDGSSTTSNIWEDAEKTTAAANPIVLDTRGANVRFFDGTYHVIVKTSAGVTLLDEYDVAITGEVDFGGLYVDVKSTYGTNGAAIQLAIDTVSSSATVLLFQSGTYTIAQDIESPDNVMWKIMPGVRITPSVGNVVTINGAIDAFDGQWIYGNGRVSIPSANAAIRWANWWGGENLALRTNVSVSGNLDVYGATVYSGKVSANAGVSANKATVGQADINSGTVDNTVIGATTPAAGTFTTVNATAGIITKLNVGGANGASTGRIYASDEIKCVRDLAVFHDLSDTYGTVQLYEAAGGASKAGVLLGGGGAGNYDTNLYRNSSGNLRTDDSLTVEGKVSANAGASVNILSVGQIKNRLIINDTSNANNLGGLTIQQLTRDDEVLSEKSSDVAHGFTARTETNTYGLDMKRSATLGGREIDGYSDGDATGLHLNGFIGATDPTDSKAAIVLNGSKWNGSNDGAVLGDAETIIDIQNGFASKVVILGSGKVSANAGISTNRLMIGNDVGLYRSGVNTISTLDQDKMYTDYLTAYNITVNNILRATTIKPKTSDSSTSIIASQILLTGDVLSVGFGSTAPVWRAPSGTAPVYSTNRLEYKMVGRLLYWWLYCTGDGGAEGSGAVTLQFQLPSDVQYVSHSTGSPIGNGYYVNNTTYRNIIAIATASTNNITFMDVGDNALLQAGDQNNATRAIYCTGVIEVVPLAY